MRHYGKDRRQSTLRRYTEVHETYEEIIKELGDLANVVSKSYIYDKIKERTGLCTKTIAYVLNHTEK